jgi:sulfite exporter TauE/SafE/copper chaperone CopZ
MSKTKHYRLSISGMQCVDCENSIETAVSGLPGVSGAKADFAKRSLVLDINPDVTSLSTVCAAVKECGYDCVHASARKSASTVSHIAVMLAAVAGMLTLLQLNRFVKLDISFDDINEQAGFGVVFLIGILSSFHCIGMCGGFVLSYTAGGARTGRPSYLNHLLYGVGKTVSYTSVGAVFGFIGGAVNITTGMQSVAMALAGGFLIVYGLSLLEAFSSLRRFHIRLPRFLIYRINEQRRKASNPLIIGLLNGLMIACGPLQAMYIMAAGIGSPVYGALLLAVFALGTLPIMFAFGLLSSLMTANATRNLLKLSGIVVMLMGAVMLNRSLLLSGMGYDINFLLTKVSENSAELINTLRRDGSESPMLIQEGYQVIYTEVESYRYVPDRYTLKKNMPVKWVLNVKELSLCNQKIVVPDLNMAVDLKPGLQMVEFLPKKSGVIGWSCSMGMISGSFIVKD